jgi:hypothetical protein
MQNHLLDQIIAHFGQAEDTEPTILQRLRHADSVFATQYATASVDASAAYGEPWVRAAYLLRYLPHYTLQLGDLLQTLEGNAAVSAILSRPQLRHAALCGGPAPEPIALAVLHAQAGGQELMSTVLDRQADVWRDCWPLSASTAKAFSGHRSVQIDGRYTDLAQPPVVSEQTLLASCQVLTMMNCLNELMSMGSERLRQQLMQRLQALAPGSLVLITDQANYIPCERGMAMLQELLEGMGARILVARTTKEDCHMMANRFDRSPRLVGVYGRAADQDGPFTKNYRVNNSALQLAAVLPG